MPFWDGPETMLPPFEGPDQHGETFRTGDWKQFHHMVVVFAGGDNKPVQELARRAGEMRANNGGLVVVCPEGVSLVLPPDVPVVRDAGSAIERMYRPILPEWNPPVAFVADRYGEIMATADATDPEIADHVIFWLFSAEVQCAL